jgi:hypothetical protein
MADKNDESVVDETVDVTTDETTVTDQDKNAKMFNREQVNKMVSERLSRERKQHKQLSDTWEGEKNEFVSQIEKYENIISTTVTEMKKNVSVDVLELLDEKSVLDQYEWLMKHIKKEPKKTIDSTPEPETKKPVSSIKNRNLY